MNGDHPTAGDYAQATANRAQNDADRNSQEIIRLKSRVQDLENTVTDLLISLSHDGLIKIKDI